MIEKQCDLWTEPAEYRCILTSGATVDGDAVLDTPSARAAGERFAGLATDLGRLLLSKGNHVHLIRPGLLSFPVREYQWSEPSLEIIGRSASQLQRHVGDARTLLPAPAVAPAALDNVRRILSDLPDNVCLVLGA